MDIRLFLVIGAAVVGIFILVAVPVAILRRSRSLGESGATGGKSADSKSIQPAAQRPSEAFPLRSPTMPTKTALILNLVVLAGIALAAGLASYCQHENIRRARLLQGEGVVAPATVVDKEIDESVEDEDACYVTYTFHSNPGKDQEQEITCQNRVPCSIYTDFEPGEMTEIIYAPSEPTVARLIADYSPGAVGWQPTIIGASIVLPSVGLLVWFFRLYRQATHLDKQGVTLQVPVLDKYEVPGDEGTSYYIAYQFPGDVPFRHSVSAALYKRFQVGAQVTIQYLPDDPRIFRLQR